MSCVGLEELYIIVSSHVCLCVGYTHVSVVVLSVCDLVWDCTCTCVYNMYASCVQLKEKKEEGEVEDRLEMFHS